eukprot:4217150-Pyramimonas_sp.AAC.2
MLHKSGKANGTGVAPPHNQRRAPLPRGQRATLTTSLVYQYGRGGCTGGGRRPRGGGVLDPVHRGRLSNRTPTPAS